MRTSIGRPTQRQTQWSRPYNHSKRTGACSSSWATVLPLAVVAVLCLTPAYGHSCPERCDLDRCESPRDCPGGLVPDYCKCCEVCARQGNQTCGGQYSLYGQCDRDLVCVIQLSSGQLVTGDEQGVCQCKSDKTFLVFIFFLYFIYLIWSLNI